MANDILTKGDAADTPRLDTLSYYDSMEPGADERPYFTKVEEQRGRKGHHINTEKHDTLFFLKYRDFIAVPGLYERGGDHRLALSKLFETQGYRVVLSGLGRV